MPNDVVSHWERHSML